MAIIGRYQSVLAIAMLTFFVFSPESAAQFDSFFLPSYSITLDFLNSWMPPRLGTHSSGRFWPPSRLIFSDHDSHSNQEDMQPRLPSPARQCRISGACRSVNHGTALPTSWKIQKSTISSATTRYLESKTTPFMSSIEATNFTISTRANVTLPTIEISLTGPLLPGLVAPIVVARAVVTTLTTPSLTTPSVPSATVKIENPSKLDLMSTIDPTNKTVMSRGADLRTTASGSAP